MRDRGAVRSALSEREPGRARAPRVHPEPVARRGLHVRRGRERHAQRARGGSRGGHRAGARHDLRRRPTARSRTTRSRSPRTTRCAACRASPTRATRPSPTGSCQLWALQHPDAITTIVRPCIVFGPNVDNYLVRLWTKQPFAVDVGNLDSQIQFVHEDDVVEAVSGLLLGRHAGAVQPGGRRADDAARVRRAARARRSARCRCGLYRALAKRAVAAAPVRGAARPDRLRALPVDRVEREDQARRSAGPRSTRRRETFEITMRAHGKLPPAEPPAPVAATQVPLSETPTTSSASARSL